MAAANVTPMVQQYLDVKNQHPDELLFFRLGDFYEMFYDDAIKASEVLNITLTKRSGNDDIPMCGVPYHSADSYIARLIAKGYKVSICEQMEDPSLAKGLVKREIIRTVTPGTVLDDACLDAGRSNYLCGVYLDDTGAGLCACDISTGQTHATAFSGPDAGVHLLNEVARFSPAEIILNDTAAQDAALRMLTELAGNRHTVCTGVTVRQGGKAEAFTVSTDVYFRPCTEEELRAYIATGEPMDKAGAYGVQSLGALLVERIDGDFYNVMGLPVEKLGQCLTKHFGVRFF